jgi:hypothetical protein
MGHARRTAREGVSGGSLRCNAELSEQRSVLSLKLVGELVYSSEALYPFGERG